MDFYKLIRTVEDLLFEFASWLILWPKTFIKIVVSPAWVNGFVDNELKKSSQERFDQFLSPLVFFLLSILPEFTLKELRPIGAKWTSDMVPGLPSDMSLQTRFLVLALTYVTLPLIFSVIAQKSSGGEVSRTALSPRFQKHAMIAACCFFLGSLTDDIVAPMLSIRSDFMLLPALVWLLYAEQRLLSVELAKGWLATLVRVLGGAILWILIGTWLFKLPQGLQYLAAHR